MPLSMLVYTGQLVRWVIWEGFIGVLLNQGKGNGTDEVKQVFIGVNQEEGTA